MARLAEQDGACRLPPDADLITSSKRDGSGGFVVPLNHLYVGSIGQLYNPPSALAKVDLRMDFAGQPRIRCGWLKMNLFRPHHNGNGLATAGCGPAWLHPGAYLVGSDSDPANRAFR